MHYNPKQRSADGGVSIMTDDGATTLTTLAPDTLERLRRISTPTLTTQLFKLGFRNTSLHGVRPLCPDRRMAGPAVTVRFVPAREDRGGYEVLADPLYPQ